MFTLVMGIIGFVVGVSISALGGAWWVAFVGLGAGMAVGYGVSESVDSLKCMTDKTIKALTVIFGVFSLAVLAFVLYSFLSSYDTIATIFGGYIEDFSDTGIAYALLQLLFGFPIRVIINMVEAKEITLLGWGMIAAAIYGIILVFWYACSGLAVSAEEKKGYYVVTRDVHSGAEIARREASAEGLAFKENAIISLVVFLVTLLLPFLPLSFGIGGMIGSLLNDYWGKRTLYISGAIAAVLLIGFPIVGSLL